MSGNFTRAALCEVCVAYNLDDPVVGETAADAAEHIEESHPGKRVETNIRLRAETDHA